MVAIMVLGISIKFPHGIASMRLSVGLYKCYNKFSVKYMYHSPRCHIIIIITRVYYISLARLPWWYVYRQIYNRQMTRELLELMYVARDGYPLFTCIRSQTTLLFGRSQEFLLHVHTCRSRSSRSSYVGPRGTNTVHVNKKQPSLLLLLAGWLAGFRPRVKTG